MDIEIFTLLKEQAREVYGLLIIVRNFASGSGLQKDVEKINSVIIENKNVRSLAEKQLADLKNIDLNTKMRLFDTLPMF